MDAVEFVFSLCNVLVFGIGVWFGFYMGRKTRGEVVFQPNPNKDTSYVHGQPVLDEYDAFEEAASVGKLENTVKDSK